MRRSGWSRTVAAVCLVTGCTVLAACGGGTERGDGVRVTRVIDGDTVETERLGKVRLIGVDTPEEGRCGEAAATRFTRRRLEGRVVEYELGEERRDRYHRTLAYLSRDDGMHNLALVRAGLARVLTIPPNDKYERRFERAERRAKRAGHGLWGRCERGRTGARRAAARPRREPELDRRADRGGCLPASACPGRRDGDGDGCYCE